jgi:hypothetical protein
VALPTRSRVVVPEVQLGRHTPDIDVRKQFADFAARQATKTKFEAHPKVVFFIGRGRTGKTTNMRYLIRELERRDAGFAVLDVDATNPVLNQYVDFAHLPPSHDPDALIEWIADHIMSTIALNAHVLIDLGGGDTSLGHLLSNMPGFVQNVEDSGAGVLALCALGSSPDDLGPLANLHRVGFRPSATVLLLNEASLGSTGLHSESFIDVQEHSIYRMLINEQNAVPLLIPRLSVAEEIERRRLGFELASKGSAGAGGKPLTITQRIILGAWLQKMADVYEPIAGWFA